MTRARWAVLLVGTLLAVAAAMIVVWPLHANGVTGSALLPNYHDFGFTSTLPIPDHPSLGQLRAAGVILPQDVVARRRHWSALLGGIGVALLLGVAAGLWWSRRHSFEGLVLDDAVRATE